MILDKLPPFELSYEQFTHKKVYSDACISLPYGVKTIIWFTTIGLDYVCITIPLNKNCLDYDKASVRKSCFKSDLCYGNGTIIMGIEMPNIPIVHIYDIGYYKGKIIQADTSTYESKIKLIVAMLNNELTNSLIHKKQLSFCLPLMSSSYEELLKLQTNDNCKSYAILFVNTTIPNFTFYFYRTMNKDMNKKCIANAYRTEKYVFLLKESTEYDVMYDLYLIKNNKVQYYCRANVNTLVMSNKLYKYFKNDHRSSYVESLDAIEESDNEDRCEENTTAANKECYVYCRYNELHKCWNPISILSHDNCNRNSIVHFDNVKDYFVKHVK